MYEWYELYVLSICHAISCHYFVRNGRIFKVTSSQKRVLKRFRDSQPHTKPICTCAFDWHTTCMTALWKDNRGIKFFCARIKLINTHPLGVDRVRDFYGITLYLIWLLLFTSSGIFMQRLPKIYVNLGQISTFLFAAICMVFKRENLFLFSFRCRFT